MRGMMRCYRVFTGPFYRLCVLVLLPRAVLLFPAAVPIMRDYFLFAMFAMTIYTAYEVFMDSWAFGGIARREGQLEYVKSSARGLMVVKKSLLGNLFRQALTPALILLLYGFICRSQIEAAEYSIDIYIGILDLYLIGSFIVTAGTTAVRFMDGVALSMGASTLCVWLVLFTAVGAMNLPWLTLCVAAPLCVAAGFGSVWLIMRRVKESYYDKKD